MIVHLLIVATIVAIAVLYHWVGWTSGYDRGYGDRQDGKPHRDQVSEP